MAYNKEAQARYAQKCKTICVRVRPTDQDILDYLAQTDEPPVTLIKRLIRAEMKAKGLPVREVGKAEGADEE